MPIGSGNLVFCFFSIKLVNRCSAPTPFTFSSAAKELIGSIYCGCSNSRTWVGARLTKLGERLRKAHGVLRKGQIAVSSVGRALTDGESHATIYDLVVDPNYQRRGIGIRLMTKVLARLPVWRVMLVADRRVEPFYQRLGFESYDDVMWRCDRSKLFDPR
jgi:ribosomal protein S18 acetylase RimI-like enzyme